MEKFDIGTPLPAYIYMSTMFVLVIMHKQQCRYMNKNRSMVFYKHIVYYRPTEN